VLSSGNNDVVLGPLIIAVVIVLVLPVVFLVTGGIIAAITAYFLRANGEATHEGSELIDLNK
jgi:hypothetical protein